MKVDRFIKNAMVEISAGCRAAKVDAPEKVEFLIRLNEKGQVCSAQQPPVSEVKVIVYYEKKEEE